MSAFLQVIIDCKCGSQQVGCGTNNEAALDDACVGHGHRGHCDRLCGMMGVYVANCMTTVQNPVPFSRWIGDGEDPERITPSVINDSTRSLPA